MHKNQAPSYFSFLLQKELEGHVLFDERGSISKPLYPKLKTNKTLYLKKRVLNVLYYMIYPSFEKAFYTILKSWLCWRARKLTNNYRSIVWDNEGFLQMAFNTQIWLNVQARNKCYQMCWTECLIFTEYYPCEIDFDSCNCHFHRNFIWIY